MTRGVRWGELGERMKNLKSLLFVGLLVLTSANFALAQVTSNPCDISGNIVAMPNPDPLGPGWMYTLTITWDTGSQYALSHMNMIMDSPGGTCTCQDFEDAIVWANPVGSSDGEGGCTVNYEGLLQCDGDPSIPGADGIMLKFEPIEEGCDPGTTGTATFVFYSELGPAPIDEDFLSLVDKYALNSCWGGLSGDFPSMSCDPVSTEPIAWGKAKSLFR